ncbi:MAG TPA: hypothetical protein DCR61_14470 [Verrucomicrobiales bacterium]|nr:hypothetical protein [Verrucomicrobiales bacterium]
MEPSMKQNSIRLVVGFLVFTGFWYSYTVLFDGDMAWPGILSISLCMSLGQEFLVRRMVQWGQAQGWVSKKRSSNPHK